jgi:hypothetical protein
MNGKPRRPTSRRGICAALSCVVEGAGSDAACDLLRYFAHALHEPSATIVQKSSQRLSQQSALNAHTQLSTLESEQPSEPVALQQSPLH